MIMIISPAKNMTVSSDGQFELSQPVYKERSRALLEQLRELYPADIEALMKVNEKIAVQAFLDYQNLEKNPQRTAALLAYQGLVFKNIGAETFDEDEMLFANDHLRILSAFYGVLKPLDGIWPYRLEMQCPMKIEGKNLYGFWGEQLYTEIAKKDTTILNLASDEYSKSVRKYKTLSDRFIDVEFKVWRHGKLRTMATWAKMARGQMVRYIVKNRIENPEQIKAFSWDDYVYEESLSNLNKYVFCKSTI